MRVCMYVCHNLSVRPVVCLPRSTCLREVQASDASFQAQCEAANSVERYVTALLLARWVDLTLTLTLAHPNPS